ncbi:MAG: hypothetical protein HY527_02840 [Betaproteobacteria bacterium]|nr:hypothetical protein [Betaproteobacteria bacterium]
MRELLDGQIPKTDPEVDEGEGASESLDDRAGKKTSPSIKEYGSSQIKTPVSTDEMPAQQQWSWWR